MEKIMVKQFEIDCAQMAGRAYQYKRENFNKFPIPTGWTEFFHLPIDSASNSWDFEAISLTRK
jgi:hypothetical protein